MHPPNMPWILSSYATSPEGDPAMLEVITLFIAGADGPRISQNGRDGMYKGMLLKKWVCLKIEKTPKPNG
jgi:hypothetical protein